MNSACSYGEKYPAYLVFIIEALETCFVVDVSVPLAPGAEESGRPLYWGVNPLKNRLVQCCFSLFNQRGLCSPLGSDIHDQDDLSLELLEIVLLVAREFGLEVVEFGHCSGEVWRGSEKLTVRLKVKMGRQ